MNYNFLMNAECIEGFKRYKWAKFGRAQTSQSSNAIDELSRLFTWGQNSNGDSGQGNPRYISPGNYERPDLMAIECAIQVGWESNWVKTSSSEESTIALNKNNELWGWGNQRTTDCSAFGLPIDSGEGRQSWMGVPDPGNEGYFYVPTRVAPGYLFKDVAHDMYHTIAIGIDDKLYVFGVNNDHALGFGVDEGVNFHTPVLHPILTADIKFIDCEYLCNVAVTADDKVYVWGWNAWYWAGGFGESIPTEITGLVIPNGETIIDVSLSPYGVIIVLSNGEIWAAGDSTMFGDAGASFPIGTPIFEQIPALLTKYITKAKATAFGGISIFVLDIKGNIWGFSNDPDWYTGSTLVPVINTWGLIGAEFEDERIFIDFSNNTHSQVYQAIDSNGYLWTWGLQSWGPHLAICAKGTSSMDSYEPYIEEEVHLREIAGYAEDALLYNGDPALLNVFPLEDSEYLQPLPQLLRHRPCGHWHVRLFEEEELWPRNCWMPSVSIYQNHLMFVACGKHLQQGGDAGCEVIIFDYDMDANIWTLASYTDLVNAANFPGGASIYDDTMVFANWKADASGTDWYDVQYTNFGLGVWVLDRGSDYALNYTHFASKNGMYMQGKAAAFTGGIAAVAYENAAGQLLVQVSTDYGVTWNLRRTVGVDANRKDWSLCIDKNGYIFLAHQVSHASIKVERSIDNGINWTVQAWANFMISNTLEIKIVADNDMLFLFASSAIGSAVERSSNSGVSWSTISGESYADALVSSGCNVDDGNSDIAFVTSGEDLNNYLYDTDYGGYNWLTRSIPQINEEGLETNTYQGPRLADLNGYNGRFAYSSYLFYTIPVPYVAVVLSVDRGITWFVRGTPLGWYDSSELSNFRGCPLFCLTDVPHLNHIWTFEKSNWAAEFVKQKDKYKVEQPCICPQYRGT